MATFLYWADSFQGSIYRANLDGSDPQVWVDEADIPSASGGSSLLTQQGVAVTGDFLYWTDSFQDSIYRANLDGTSPEVLIDEVDIPLASTGSTNFGQQDLIVAGDFLYWTDIDQDSIYRANLDGTNPQVLIDVATIPFSSQGITNFTQSGLVIDGSFLYWTDNAQRSIYRANLDGTNPEVLVDVASIPLASGSTTPDVGLLGLAIDGGFLYWADTRQDSIYRASLDGSNPEVLIDGADIPLASGDSTSFNQTDLVVDGGLLYWTDRDQDSLYRANLDGSNPEVLIDGAAIPPSSDLSTFYNQNYLTIGSGTPDTTPPVIITLTPEDDVTLISPSDNLQIRFDAGVQAGTGFITLKRLADDSVIEAIDINSAQVSLDSFTLTIDPTNDLPFGTDIYVEIDTGAIQDLSGNNFGITDNTTWNFATFAEGAVINLADLDGSNGFVINGIDPSDSSGRSVSGAGDINGDGIDDILIGAPNAAPNGNSDAGESYVVFGSDQGFSASLELSAIEGTNGIEN